MTSRTHDVGAVAALLTAGIYFPPTNLGIATLIVALIANVVGSLLPDIDQASNRLWDLLPGGNFIGKILKKIFLSHRTLSHSFLGVYLMYKINEWLIFKIFNPTFVDPQIIFWALMIGYVSHLILDGLTEGGLPLLWPIKWKFGFPPIRSWRIKTDGWFEKWVVFPLIIIFIIRFSWLHWQELVGLIK